MHFNFNVDLLCIFLYICNFNIIFATKISSMATENEVGRFLQQFFQKAKTFGLFFRDDRGKNMQTLLDLDITPKQRKEIIM